MTASWRPITPGRANRNLSRLGAKRSVTGEIVSDIPPGPALAISHFAQRRRHCARPRAPNHDRDRAGCEVTSRPLGTGGGSGFPAHRLFPAHDRKATMIVAGQPLVATHDNYPNPAQLTEGLEARVLPGGAVTRHFQTLHQARVTVYSPEMAADSSPTATARSSNSATCLIGGGEGRALQHPAARSARALQIEWLRQGGLERVAGPDPRSYVWR